MLRSFHQWRVDGGAREEVGYIMAWVLGLPWKLECARPQSMLKSHWEPLSTPPHVWGLQNLWGKTPSPGSFLRSKGGLCTVPEGAQKEKQCSLTVTIFSHSCLTIYPIYICNCKEIIICIVFLFYSCNILKLNFLCFISIGFDWFLNSHFDWQIILKKLPLKEISPSFIDVIDRGFCLLFWGTWNL